MVEVDLRLFVTCRLCLDVQGHFQIDHNVKKQFKYCFDIDVEPFDGLPQLICKDCENILKDYSAIKKKFIDKQKALKTKQQESTRKVAKSPSPQQDESDKSSNKTKEDNVPSSSRLDDSDSCSVNDEYDKKITRKKKKVKKNRIIKRYLSSSEDDLDSNDLTQTQKNASAEKHSYNADTSWDANFKKYFVCRICSQGFQDKEGITQHINKHNALQMKYRNIFKMSCLVVMEKSDNKPNMCNNNKAVVYSPDSVIQNTHNPFYYTKYHPKTYSDIPTNFEYVSNNKVSSAESSDGELICKRRRLSSRGSSETVILNRHSEHEDTPRITENNKKPPTVIDCIDLSDSSDNGSYESNEKRSNSNNKEKLDSKPMNNIIKMCHNKYTKQADSRERNKVKENDKVKEDLLQHKVLSIGRKVINNNGFNCTGLLRFLEYKDLSVIWKETSVVKANGDGKYVRIATRVRGNESSDPKNSGWKNFNLFKFEHEDNFKSVNILKKLKTLRNFKNITENSNKKNEDDINSIEKLPRISSVFSHSDLEISKVDPDNMLLKKLLNKNPVSNPKQLPKKATSNDSNSKGMKVFSAPNTVPFTVRKIQENNDTETNSMPIVTSTVSLAQLSEETEKEPTGESVTTPTTPTNQQITYPRIKVKPVSELMPEKSNEAYVNGAQNSSQIPSLVWSKQNSNFGNESNSSQAISAAIENTQMWPKQNNSYMEQQVWPSQNLHSSGQNNTIPVKVAKTSKITDTLVMGKEYMLLDTVEFPNTKTPSPFQYLQNLLLVHNIHLLDADQPLPAYAVSLIKLKLVYQQENCDAITLCSSLFCSRNIFSIQVKDMNLRGMDINSLSANWQWQLLKIYTKDIIAKVLQTASKVSMETYKYTEQFFALLTSIKEKK